MKTIFKLSITIIAIPITFIVALIILTNIPNLSFDNGVQAKKIRQLKLGMNHLDVERILGNPTVAYPSEDATIDPKGVRTPLHPNRITYRYNRYSPWGTLASKLYIHLDEDSISTVYGKRYDLLGFDDYGVYLVDKKGVNWESKEFVDAFP